MGRVALRALAIALTHGMTEVWIIRQPADGCCSCRSVDDWEQDAGPGLADEARYAGMSLTTTGRPLIMLSATSRPNDSLRYGHNTMSQLAKA